MTRRAPAWFNSTLERIGGTNRYGEPIFKLVWSTEPRMIVGGRFPDGFVGYRWKPAVPGDPCWALMIWESPESHGDPLEWEWQYRQPDTGLLEVGSFPQRGRYRLLKQFLHRQVVQKEIWKMVYMHKLRKQVRILIQPQRVVTHTLEPCGLILDLLVPMLKAWRELSYQQKLEAVEERKQREEKERDRIVKDAMRDSRVKRSWQLVQKRAEQIDKGLDRAMAIASKYGRGMYSFA